jgi:hypothetical protein
MALPNSTNPRRQWARYTTNHGDFFAVKADRNWIANADSGLIAYGGAGPAFGSDPTFPTRVGRNRLRMGRGQNADTFQYTRWIVGTPTAAAGQGGYVYVSSAKGIAGAVNYNFVGLQDEHLLVAHDIPQAPENTGV